MVIARARATALVAEEAAQEAEAVHGYVGAKVLTLAARQAEAERARDHVSAFVYAKRRSGAVLNHHITREREALSRIISASHEVASSEAVKMVDEVERRAAEAHSARLLRATVEHCWLAMHRRWAEEVVAASVAAALQGMWLECRPPTEVTEAVVRNAFAASVRRAAREAREVVRITIKVVEVSIELGLSPWMVREQKMVT